MNFDTLRAMFHDRAVELGESKEPSAKFRSTSYERVAHRLENDFKASDIPTKESIESMDISDYMKKKALEFMNGKKKTIKTKKTKTLKMSKSSKKTVRKLSKSPSKSPKVSPKASSKSPAKSNPKLIKELSEFMGLGPERAKVLIEAGLTKINQIHMKKFKAMLPEETKLFIDLKPLQKIPNEHIKILEPYIKNLQINADIILVGSYRRGKSFSSDIDVMIVSEDENIIEKFLVKLKEVLDDKVYPYSKGRDKLSLIVDMSASGLLEEKDKVYKIDAFRTTPDDKIPMLLYSTGSKEFNILMRGRAKKKGYLLNQKGLFKDGKKINNLNNEEAYFELLEMPYKEPKDRT